MMLRGVCWPSLAPGFEALRDYAVSEEISTRKCLQAGRMIPHDRRFELLTKSVSDKGNACRASSGWIMNCSGFMLVRGASPA